MTTNIYLFFPGTCREAFAFYEKTFRSKIVMTSTYGESPVPMPVGEEAKDLVMHTAMPLGSITLMGSDSTATPPKPLGGFDISVDMNDTAEVHRLFDALGEGGSVRMPLQPTFWTPLFGRVTDRFGVGWMVSQTGPEPPQ